MSSSIVPVFNNAPSLAERARRVAAALSRHTDIPHRFFLFLGGGIITLSLLYVLFDILQYLIWGRVLLGGLAVITMLVLFFRGRRFWSWDYLACTLSRYSKKFCIVRDFASRKPSILENDLSPAPACMAQTF